jgi:hypothetical protein
MIAAIVILLFIIALGVLWPRVGKFVFIALLALSIGGPILFVGAALSYSAGGWTEIFEIYVVLPILFVIASLVHNWMEGA